MRYQELYDKAKTDKRLVDVTPKYMEFKKKGAFIIGQFLGHATIKSTRGPGHYNQYLFMTDAGLIKFAMGGATDKEVMPLMKVNDVYHIEFDGKEKLKGGNEVNKFKVTQISVSEDEMDALDTREVSTGIPSPVVGGDADIPF